jgi:hypothetical protein
MSPTTAVQHSQDRRHRQLSGSHHLGPRYPVHAALVQISAGQQVKWQWVNGSHPHQRVSSNRLTARALWDVALDSKTRRSSINSASEYYPFLPPARAPCKKGAIMVRSTTGVGGTGHQVPFDRQPQSVPRQRAPLRDRGSRQVGRNLDLNGRRVLTCSWPICPQAKRMIWGGWDVTSQWPRVYFALPDRQWQDGDPAIFRLDSEGLFPGRPPSGSGYLRVAPPQAGEAPAGSF